MVLDLTSWLDSNSREKEKKQCGWSDTVSYAAVRFRHVGVGEVEASG